MSRPHSCPLLVVEPVRGMVDEQVRIQVQNVGAQRAVTLHCLHHSEDGDLWDAFGHYISDPHGQVTVVQDSSVGGTYLGVEPMGLLWSLRPIPGSRTGLRLRKRYVLSPMVYHVSVYDGHATEGFQKLRPLLTVTMERWYMAPGVQRVCVNEKDVQGTLFIPPGPGPFPGVLDMWGGGGGLVEYRAALLASHGLVAFALEYLPAGEGNAAHIYATYFEAAYQILQEHPLVHRDSVALLGLSFGVTVTLSMVAYSKIIKPRCCVCISGSHVFPITSTLSEVYEQFNRMIDKLRLSGSQVIWRDLLLPIPSDPDLKVNVGQIQCPVLLIVGEDDQSWATVESAEDIQRMMEEAGNQHLLQVIKYPGAGHLIEPPYTPHHRASNYMIQKEKVIMLWGGQSKPHADAQEDSWRKILDFLHHHLHHNTLQSRL